MNFDNVEIQRRVVNENVDLIKELCFKRIIDDGIVIKGYDLYVEIGKEIGLSEEQCLEKHGDSGAENYLKTKVNWSFFILKEEGMVTNPEPAVWLLDENIEATTAEELEHIRQKRHAARTRKIEALPEPQVTKIFGLIYKQSTPDIRQKLNTLPKRNKIKKRLRNHESATDIMLDMFNITYDI